MTFYFNHLQYGTCSGDNQVEIVNKGLLASDVVVNYQLVNNATGVTAVTGSDTVFVSGMDQKQLVIDIPQLPNGVYNVTVSTTSPVIATANSQIAINTPLWLTNLWIIIAVIAIIIFAAILLSGNDEKRRK